jgi:hypothetical protein
MVNFVGKGICLRASDRATVYALKTGKHFFSATPTLHYSPEGNFSRGGLDSAYVWNERRKL